MVNKMKKRRRKINKKLVELGKPLGISEIEAVRSKRTVKNIISMAVFIAVFAILGSILMPGGPSGLYYTGGGVKDFQILFGCFI